MKQARSYQIGCPNDSFAYVSLRLFSLHKLRGVKFCAVRLGRERQADDKGWWP